MMCSRCKKRIAVVFLSRMEGGETINEGLCLKCARELGIKPVNDLMDQMGVTEEDIDNVSGQLEEFMESGDYEELFSPGGAATFPFMADGNDLAEGVY